MDPETYSDLLNMARRWREFALKTFQANGTDDRYGRGLQVCSEQLTEALERIDRDRAALEQHVTQTCPGGC